MTIKEIEELVAMPRANIRYYEEQGLLSPARDINGYRDYSEWDLSVLKKIKLLRSLHMPLDEIKALHTGEQELSVALQKQIQKLSADKEDLSKAQIVCETMYRDRIKYENLDAEKYLQDFSWDTKESNEDTTPKVQAPWRRYFARVLDRFAYSVLWSCFLMLVFNVNITNQGFGLKLAEFVMTLLLTMVLEPLQLALFGTTLGKGILGIHVLHNDDRKLSFSEAYDRTKQVLFYGFGFYIPILSWFFLWKSYKSCKGGENLEWEYDTRIILKDEKKVRMVLYVATQALLVGVLIFASIFVQIPFHRGELTIAEFCENYRRLEKYYGISSTHTLDDKGIWKDSVPNDGEVIYDPFPCEAPPAFMFETDSEGNIQRICFVIEEHIPEEIPKEERQGISSCQSQMQLAVLAFVGAQDEFSHFSSALEKMVEIVASHEFKDYEFTEAGIKVVCDVEWQGYEVWPGYNQNGNEVLIPLAEGESSFYMEFSMSSEE